jgi:hypothetical protein
MATLSHLTWIVMDKVGTSKFRKRVWKENSLLFLFLISWYAFETD